MAVTPNPETLVEPVVDAAAVNTLTPETNIVAETTMPEDDKYINNVFLNLKDEYGSNFDKSEEEFYNKITTNKEYAKNVFLNLKDLYGENFTKTENEFYDLVLKKKDISQISSEISSEGSEVSSDVVPVEEKIERKEGDTWEENGISWTFKGGKQIDASGYDVDGFNYDTGEWKGGKKGEAYKKFQESGGFEPNK